MRQNTVFLGLTRPAKIFGLPVGYFTSLSLGSVLPFIAADDMRFLLIGVVLYPILYVVADRQPNLFEIFRTVYTATPPTKNRKLHDGDAYSPLIEKPSRGALELLGDAIMKEEPAAKHLPYLSPVSDTIILTRQGDIMASAVIDGIDSFTADDKEVDVQAEAFQRHIGQFGDAFAYWVNKITIPEEITIAPIESDPFSTEVDRRWRNNLKRRNLKRRVLMVSVLLRPSLTQKFSLFKSDEDQLVTADRIEKLEEAMRVLESNYSESGYRRMSVSSGEWLGLLASIQGQPYQKRLMRSGRYIADVITNSTFTFKDKTVVIDDGQTKRFGAMIGIHEYGGSSTPRMLDALELPYDIIITNSYTPLRSNEAVSKMELRRRQMRATDGPARSLIADLEESADRVASGREHYGYEQLSVLVLADTKEELEKATSDVWQAAQATGATVVRERANLSVFKGAMSAMFFGQAPGNYAYRPRQVMLSGDNFADLAAFHKTRSGRPKEQSPWAENITLLPTITSGIYKFNFHEAGNRRDEPSNGHVLTLGRMGSGKTLGSAFLISQARRVGARVMVFDKDHGLEMAVRAMGGTYSSLQIGDPTGFNPFQTEVDERGEAWLIDWCIDLFSRNKPLDTIQTVALTNAVRQIVQVDPSLRSFEGLAKLVTSTDDDGDLLERVREWTARGRYGWLFSGTTADPIAMHEEILGIDMSAVLDMKTERSALLSYLFARVERMIEGRTPTMVVIDEAWKLLDDELFVKRLSDWLLTMRKKNCVVVLMTQYPSHLERSSVGKIIAESASTQILFPNKSANPEDYEILKLNESEAELLSTPTGGARIALVRSGGDSVVVNMDLSGLGGALTVLGGGKTGETRAGFGWREDPNFWEKMI